LAKRLRARQISLLVFFGQGFVVREFIISTLKSSSFRKKRIATLKQIPALLSCLRLKLSNNCENALTALKTHLMLIHFIRILFRPLYVQTSQCVRAYVPPTHNGLYQIAKSMLCCLGSLTIL
jgi:hypothetical protein